MEISRFPLSWSRSGCDGRSRLSRTEIAQVVAISTARKSLTLVSVGPVTKQVADGLEEGPRIVVGEQRLGVRRPWPRRAPAYRGKAARRHCPPSRRCRRCRRQAQRCRARRRARAASASRNSVLRPPLPLPLHRHGGLAARQQHAGRRGRLRMVRALARDAGMDETHVARLALDGVAEDHRRHARLRARPRRRLRATFAAWRS